MVQGIKTITFQIAIRINVLLNRLKLFISPLDHVTCSRFNFKYFVTTHLQYIVIRITNNIVVFSDFKTLKATNHLQL